MSADDQVRIPLSYDEAVSMLPPGEKIHTWIKQPGGEALGADWDRQQVLDALREGSPELAGKMAAALEHAIVAFRDTSKPVFINTRPGQ